jgi:uncharacterized protein involved in outer membrane biogenesis
MTVTMSRTVKWIGLGLAVLAVLIGVVVVSLGESHLRGTIAQLVTVRTGRQLAINGDLQWKLDWPRVRLHANDVTFANPPWAREKQMIAATAVDLSIDLPRLLGGTLFLPDVRFDRPNVSFERGADGRRNWLLDRDQTNDNARAWVGRLTLVDGRISYDDPIQDTSILVEISRHDTPTGAQGGAGAFGITFKASGKYLGLPLAASGTGGTVLALRDEAAPYPLALVATAGPTSIRVDGTVTHLMDEPAIDATIALNGASLAEFFDLLALPLPETHAYRVAGHLTRNADGWQYDKFSGRIGQSEVAGTLHGIYAATRPLVEGELAFKSLDLADLGPVVGKDVTTAPPSASLRGRKAAEPAPATGSRALPARVFRRDRWTAVDADIAIKAQTILRPKALPLEHLTARLQMRKSVLTLDPLDFGAAEGDLVGAIRLDGQHTPIQAHAKLEVRKLQLGKLLPTVALTQNSVGEINGEIELTGRGDSVAQMLATADGKVGLVVEGGKTSKLLMEEVALHVPEILLQQIAGDQLIDIRCGVADFSVEHGVMQVRALMLDTDVTEIAGTGSVDLATEKLDVKLIPNPKRMSLFALRGPISVRGDLSHPDLAFDTGRVAAQGLASLVLAAINPALSLITLADPGSAKESACNVLARQARAPWKRTASAEKRAPA